MSFMLVYNKPGRGAYVYQIGARSLIEATEAGRDLGNRNPGHWGEFRYARSSFRAPIVLNEFYVLQPGAQGLRYRKEWEEVNAPFDYVNAGDILRFDLEWQEPISKGTVSLRATFGAGRAFKFMDLCRQNLAKFVLRDGTPVLQFFNRLTFAPVGEIVLQTEH
jgi:hypothetical protein